MPLFVPFLLFGGSAVLGGLGIKKGYDGLSSLKEAKERGEQAQARHRRHVRIVEDARQDVNQDADAYGECIVEVRTHLFGRLVQFLERIKQRGGKDALELLAEAEVNHRVLCEFKAQSLEAASMLKGAMAAGTASAAAMSATYSSVGLIGVASTGTAISGLSGAAATNATLAWLGGGSLAAGGFGMAGGMVVLGGIMAAPALLISGFVFASQGEKALTKAADYIAKVDKAIADLDLVIVFLRQLRVRIREMHGLVNELSQRLDAELRHLEKGASRFDIKKANHRDRLRQTMLLAKGVSEVMKTPVLTDDGEINLQSASIIAKYRSLT